MTKNSETIGTLQIFLVALLWGMFPVVVNKGSQHISPLFFAATSVFVGAITATIISLIKKNLKEITNKKAWKFGIIVALASTTFPYALMFIGSQLTSGINTAALLLSEIIFTLTITPFLGEKPGIYKTLSGFLVLTGAFMILFKGGSGSGINTGDILIFFSTLSLPFGNYFGKKALAYITGENLLIIRYLVGGIFLLLMSFTFEDKTAFISSSKEYWPYIAINGILLLGLTNTLWYKGLKKLEVSKAISILMTYPFFSLIFLMIFYKEKPSFYQLLGLIIIVMGGFFSARSGKTRN